MTIKDVDFGRLDAESDKKLKLYFIDTGVIERIARGERQFVIGRKGSGKTALFQFPNAYLLGHQVVRLEFSDYAWELHKAIRELGLPAENAYTSSWVFTFLVSACRTWMHSGKGEVAKRAKELYVKIYGATEGGTSDILFDRLKRLRKLEAPNAGDVGGLGAIEFDPANPGAHLAQAANAWNQKLLALADANFSTHPISIFVDRLDDGWDASPEMKCMLAGAIKAARSLNLRFGSPKRPPFCVLFMRSDIYSYLEFNDKNKIGADIEHVVWNGPSLLDIANARIGDSLPVKKADAWAAVFSMKQMRQRSYISNYILKRTMERPRDLIAFCIYCREVAVERGHAIVETDDVYEAEIRYSRHIYEELKDEMHKQVPEYEHLFKALNVIGCSRFTFSDWQAALSQVSSTGASEDAKEKLQTLFEYAVVGVPKVGGKGGGSSFEFIYENRFLEPNFSGEMVVHPALKKHLRLKDSAAGANGNGEELSEVAPQAGQSEQMGDG